ncbi:MAG: zf-HC2 domain-containing protein [Chloroflexi bacterium]|nr:zf-HC2 domain-containing protein [Chloroflexota bacterium]
MKNLTESKLNEYLDNTLNASARREADSHIQSCADCRARLNELQSVFTALAGLPEARLARDLSSDILSRLPQEQPRIWTPFFAAQVGAALGMLFWLSIQLTKFVPTDFSALRFPQFSIPTFPPSAPHFPFPTLYSLFSNLYSLFTVLHPPFSIPTFNLPAFQLSTFQVAFVSIGALALWVIGNATLLRDRREVQK